ncbi:MAG: hypothetical protein IIW48_04730 [Clostridia bacterium]|nr:hypothetical protein [Clostridia bacterium]
MFTKLVFKKENDLIKEISKERNFFRMFTKAMELEGLIKYMNSSVQ